MLLRGKPSNRLEDRLDVLDRRRPRARPAKEQCRSSKAACSPSLWTTVRASSRRFLERFGNIDHLLFEQADMSLTAGKLAAISACWRAGRGLAACRCTIRRRLVRRWPLGIGCPAAGAGCSCGGSSG